MPQPASQAQRAKDLIDLASTNSDCQRDLFDPIVFINAGHNSDLSGANKSDTVLVFEKKEHIYLKEHQAWCHTPMS